MSVGKLCKSIACTKVFASLLKKQQETIQDIVGKKRRITLFGGLVKNSPKSPKIKEK